MVPVARLKQGNRPLFSETVANLRIVFFVALSIGVMTLDHRYHHLEALRNALATLTYPLQYVIQLPADTVQWLSQTLASRRALLEENAQLHRRQMLLNAQLLKLSALQAENRRLRILLESSVNIPERVLIAELLKADFDPYRHQLTLNRGTRHGVYVGQPLLDQQGIIGQIIHANTLTSTAILITDPNHALPVQVNRNGLRTLAVGTGNFQELDLPYIRNNEDIQVGDLLVTSGLGGRFPRGYPVARVTKVEFDPARPFARVVARPTTPLDRSQEMVLIIQPPTTEQTEPGKGRPAEGAVDPVPTDE